MTLPGTPVEIHEGLAERLGYEGAARKVAFTWWSGTTHTCFDDGNGGGVGNGQAFREFTQSLPFDFGSPEHSGTHALVIDREANKASVATIAEAEECVRLQHAPHVLVEHLTLEQSLARQR